MAWAKSLFQQCFVADIASLRTMLQLLLTRRDGTSCEQSKEVRALFSSLTGEDRGRLVRLLALVVASADQKTVGAAIVQWAGAWARQLHDAVFWRELGRLLEEHPADELDEDGRPFWGGCVWVVTAAACADQMFLGPADCQCQCASTRQTRCRCSL